MGLEIIKEQRMIRTLFFLLINSTDLLEDKEQEQKNFCNKVENYIRDRLLIDNDTRNPKEYIKEFLETFGWRNITIEVNSASGKASIKLGRNRYILKEIAEENGTLIFLEALFQGLGYYLLENPAVAKADLSFSQGFFYEISLEKNYDHSKVIAETGEKTLADEDSLIDEHLTIETMFEPIFGSKIPFQILFQITWKVITESFITNYPTQDANLKEAIQNESMENLRIIITKLAESEEKDEILGLAELIGEYIAKILGTRISGSLIEKLKATLQDRHQESYLIYYKTQLFNKDKHFENRYAFVHGMWMGLLNEIIGQQLEIKDVLFADKKDRYNIVEFTKRE